LGVRIDLPNRGSSPLGKMILKKNAGKTMFRKLLGNDHQIMVGRLYVWKSGMILEVDGC
jgi:hypothetical protein